MRLLANENVPRDAVEALRAAGHDVVWIRTAAPGSTDPQVLDRGVAERRILLTFDKDFGQLVYKAGHPTPPGIILFRFSLPSPEAAARRTVAALAHRSDWEGNFAVIEEGRVRITPLPPTRRP